ncbi:hypothetical protein OAO87_03580 [bacterium]|nr:hypothetical protein [bacterium]
MGQARHELGLGGGRRPHQPVQAGLKRWDHRVTDPWEASSCYAT